MKLILLVLLALQLTSCVIPPVTQTAKLSPIAVPHDAFSKSLQLNKVVARIPQAENLYRVQYGWLCERGRDRTLPVGRIPVSHEDLAAGFKSVLEPLRYKIAGEPESVFESGFANRGELQIGATINKLEANLCFPFSGSALLNVGDPDRAKGSIFMQVTWEVFSLSENKVVHKSTTQGTFQIDEAIPGAFASMALNAFTANLNNLAADQQFHALVLARPGRKTPQSEGAGT